MSILTNETLDAIAAAAAPLDPATRDAFIRRAIIRLKAIPVLAPGDVRRILRETYQQVTRPGRPVRDDAA
jgi:hypothetical protein